jgi:positive regulator of sigma E activity
MIRHKNIFKKPLFAAGLVFLGVWLILFRIEIVSNLELLFASWLTICLGIVAVAIVAFIIMRLETSRNKKTGAPVIV